MDRSMCQMCNVVNNKIYCGYYDAMLRECSDVKEGQCPEGLDDPEEYEVCDICGGELDADYGNVCSNCDNINHNE